MIVRLFLCSFLNDLWCNGSISDFESEGSGSNPDRSSCFNGVSSLLVKCLTVNQENRVRFPVTPTTDNQKVTYQFVVYMTPDSINGHKKVHKSSD